MTIPLSDWSDIAEAPGRRSSALPLENRRLIRTTNTARPPVKLGPIVPGEVLLDAFALARDIRDVDMRASPYDVSAYAGVDGSPLTAIPIETPAGKRAYADLQRGFADRGNALRARVLEAITTARAALERTDPGRRAAAMSTPAA